MGVQSTHVTLGPIEGVSDGALEHVFFFEISLRYSTCKAENSYNSEQFKRSSDFDFSPTSLALALPFSQISIGI